MRKEQRVRLGAFYTPEFLVRRVREMVASFLRAGAVVLDPAGGFGAFINHFQDADYRVADIDSAAVERLRASFSHERVFFADALSNVCREKYDIPSDAFLVVVGNPPYNDWTSLYRKGSKGEFSMDEDVFDRDLGISFLKAMDKLRADIICILHPMSYLIKKANFDRLSRFFCSYELVKAYAFPSFVFRGTSSAVGFPVLAALYRRGERGWTWDEMRRFEFELLFADAKFRLEEIQTTDGMVAKYPRRGASSLGLYFHTFRDINSLLRNKDFLLSPTNSTIPVEPESLADYAYLVALKHYIEERGARRFWLYGNFSPLVDREFYMRHKSCFFHYALEKTRALPLEMKARLMRMFPRAAEDGGLVKRHFDELFWLVGV